MALFHPNTSAFAWTPGTYDITGSFVDPSPATATANRQIRPAFITVTPTAGGAAVGADKQIAPLGALCKVYARPNGAAATAAGSDNLPRGVFQGTPDQGLYLLDLSGHAADITYAEASFAPNNFTLPITRCVQVIAVDNVNKLIYIQVVTFNTGASALAASTDQICFVIQMKDAGIAV